MAALLLPSLRLARFGNGTRGRQKRFRPSRPDRQSSGNEEMTPFGRLRIERHLDHRTVFRGMTFEMFWSKSAFPNESWRWTFMDLSAVIPTRLGKVSPAYGCELQGHWTMDSQVGLFVIFILLALVAPWANTLGRELFALLKSLLRPRSHQG